MAKAKRVDCLWWKYIYAFWNSGVEVKTNEHPYGVITRLKNQVTLVLKLPVSTVTFYVLYIFVGG